MNMHRIRIFIYFLFATTLLLPSAFAQTVVPPTTSAQTPSIPKRLTLVQAEQLLLQRNLAVLSAKYQIDASRAAKLIASFRPNPVLTVGAEQFNLSSRLFKNITHTDPNSAAASTYTIRYDQLIERGGKRELRTAQAEAQLQAAEAQMLDTLRQQLFQLRQAFTSAALARENLLLAEQTAQQYDQTVQLTEAKVENGDVAGVELYRVQAAALQYQQAVQQAQTTYQQSTRDILNLLGARADNVSNTQIAEVAKDHSLKDGAVINAAYTPATTQSNIAAALDQPSLLAEAPLEINFQFDDHPLGKTLDELRQIALAERPDVIAARRLYEAAGKSEALARSQRVRDLSVGTQFQRVGSDQTFGVSLSIPLFVHNNGLAAISQAEAQREAAAALLRQAELQAVTDVEKAYQAYLAARRTLDIYSATTLSRADKLKSVAAFSYKEGALNLLELLDAQRTYNQTMTSFNQARADYQLALWQLEAATGQTLK